MTSTNKLLKTKPTVFLLRLSLLVVSLKLPVRTISGVPLPALSPCPYDGPRANLDRIDLAFFFNVFAKWCSAGYTSNNVITNHEYHTEYMKRHVHDYIMAIDTIVVFLVFDQYGHDHHVSCLQLTIRMDMTVITTMPLMNCNYHHMSGKVTA